MDEREPMTHDVYAQRQQTLERVADICVRLGVQQFIIAPGSRSAPLVTALARRPELALRVVIDERAAAYVALGIAQQTHKPVGLVCTSGTASLNFAPAITEAFYQQVPLLVLTADRPPEWIDQQDNQAIHQPYLYEPHILGSFAFPAEAAHPDTQWHAERMMAQAIHLTTFPVAGPVHINFPLREPIYPNAPSPESLATARKLIQLAPTRPQLSEASWDELIPAWRGARRKLVVAGMHPPDERLRRALQHLGADPSVAVIADITANLYPDGTALHHSDMILGVRNPALIEQLRPDLVVNFGGQTVSKYLKQLLRQHPPHALWQLQPSGRAPDTFQSLTQILPLAAGDFLGELAQRVAGASTQKPARLEVASYAHAWRALEHSASHALAAFFGQCAFGEFKALYQVMGALPANSHLQVGNSMPIRYANFIAHLPNMGQMQVNANRGVSGIDGTVSTAVGAALTTKQITTLLVGDLAFFYDRNGLWQEHLPANLRIVLLNNHGGGIFDLIEGPNKLTAPLQQRFFLTPHPLTARRTAEDHGLDYFGAESEAALSACLAEFWAQRPRPAILEIESEIATNTQVFNQFRQLVAELSMNNNGPFPNP
jgi:2-succinyl-5-enolpyruvyl-6-hydroxy-3-cyclohexene-1-carboxylate synthase